MDNQRAGVCGFNLFLKWLSGSHPLFGLTIAFTVRGLWYHQTFCFALGSREGRGSNQGSGLGKAGKGCKSNCFSVFPVGFAFLGLTDITTHLSAWQNPPNFCCFYLVFYSHCPGLCLTLPTVILVGLSQISVFNPLSLSERLWVLFLLSSVCF